MPTLDRATPRWRAYRAEDIEIGLKFGPDHPRDMSGRAIDRYRDYKVESRERNVVDPKREHS
jgi:hypothetical protein